MEANDFLDKIDLVDYLTKQGYELDKAKSSHRQKVFSYQGEKLLILQHRKTGNYIYQNLNDSNDKGNVINFVVNRINGYLNTSAKTKQDYAKAFSKLGDETLLIPKSPVFIKKRAKFNYQLYKPEVLSDISYLLNRGILKKTLEHSIFKGRIVNCYKYSFKEHKCYGSKLIGFPCTRDNEIVGIELRSVNDKKMAFASEVVDSFWVSNYSKKHTNILLTENPIDNLSYFQIKGDDISTHISSFGTISDAQCKRLVSLIRSGVYKSITLANDNDFGGCKNDIKILSFFLSKDKLEILSTEKDVMIVKVGDEKIVLNKLVDFKMFIVQSIFSNGLGKIFLIDKAQLKDWNAELQKNNNKTLF